jgi:predicted TIM-barrel fold metal-dependent hydrolase
VAVRNREGNEYIAELISKQPNRLIGCAVANPWFGEEALNILQEAFFSGLKVLFLHPPLQGFQLSDSLIHPLIDASKAAAAPVFAHTGTAICAEPFQLSALALEFPSVDFIMGHMGYADFWYDAIAAAEMASNILIDTSLTDSDLILNAIDRIGAERVIFGSAAPISEVAVELEKVTSLPLPSRDLELILWRNAERLIP